MMVQRWSVTDLTRYLRQLVELDYRLQDLEVEGEISNLRVPASGHAYFTLKDAEAQLKCVMWRDRVLAQTVMPQDGERVIARGRVSLYEAGGQLQLYCDSLRPAGIGDLHARFEELKAQLQAEGLFDPGRKRPLPERVGTIGLVTSPTTAALQDVLKVLRRRYSLARVILSPTPVQGDQAPPGIVAALHALADHGAADVILIVRGGGSLEDLWCFNDERVARAIAASPIPTVTGIGHETDFTLADFAADLRAPTPSAAAEQVTPITVAHLGEDLRRALLTLDLSLESTLAAHRRTLEETGGYLWRLSPQARVNNARQQTDELARRAARAAHSALQLRRERLAGLNNTLSAMNPQTTLARGYAIVYGPDGSVLRRAADVTPGQPIDVRLHRGQLRARVESRTEESTP
jgi:exodeoxyribonuclease VII large subunit